MIPVCTQPVVFFVNGNLGGAVQQVPAVPRIGEIVALDGMLYRVERVIHKIDTDNEDEALIFVDVSSKPAPKPHKRRARFQP